MPSAVVTEGCVFEDGGGQFLARIIGIDGNIIGQVNITGITFSVHELASGIEIVAPVALTVVNVVFNTLQNDGRWTKDSQGYNFLHEVAASVFSTSNIKYRVEYLFDPAAGEDYWAIFEVAVVKVIRT